MQVKVTPLDPFIARDSRPFGSGSKARTLGWPYPSVIAGSLRSLLGKMAGGFTPERVRELKEIRVRGPLPCLGDEMFYPRPLDLLIREETTGGKLSREVYPVRPIHESIPTGGSGTDLPAGLGLSMPLGMPDDDFKPAAIPAFWSAERIGNWLSGESSLPVGPVLAGGWGKGFLSGLKQEERVHVGIAPESGTAEESMIFSTSGLDFVTGSPGDGYENLSMALDVSSEIEAYQVFLSQLDEIHPAGGERRLSRWEADGGKTESSWRCPDKITAALSSSGGLVRMMLASPAIFSEGWKPGWLEETGSGKAVSWEGTPPGLSPESGLRLRLVSAVTGRWLPVSGWLIEHGKTSGPKPLRRMVPSGSVYFFEVTGGDPLDLEKLWLQPVCDDRQDRMDGFGLSLWGSWTWNNDLLTR